MAGNVDPQAEDYEALRQQCQRMETELHARAREVAEINLKLKQSNEGFEKALAREQEARREAQLFMHVLSHDLRSPISTVSNFLGIILTKHGEALDERSKEYIGHCQFLIKNMGQLLTDILYYAKIGARKISKAEVDSNRVLERALANLRAGIEIKKAAVRAQDLPKIKGDETLLVQVFQNLIANSLKFTEGAPEIEISAMSGKTNDQNEWVFSFKDNGTGIGPEDRQRIFGPFERAGAGEGTGLGLAICKRVVEMHGGRIWVEPAHGKGSAFYFTIPG